MLWKLLLTTMLMFVYIHETTGQVGPDNMETAAIEEIRAIQEICDTVQDEVEAIAGVKYRTFQAVSYKTQVVAGINYFIKVKVDLGADNCVHLRVYKDLRNNVSLIAVQLDKKMKDPIEYF